MKNAFILMLTLTACAHLPRSGNAPYCRIDYELEKKFCTYRTIEECREDLDALGGLCLPNKDFHG